MMENPFPGAIEYLNEHGWTQGEFFGENGSACALGSLMVSTGYRDFWRTNTTRENRYLLAQDFFKGVVKKKGVNGEMVACWNDDPRTTEEDVKLILKEAAEEWDNSKFAGGTEK